MSEERIEPGDRVLAKRHSRVGTVWHIDVAMVGWADDFGWQQFDLSELRLVAKARYEPVEPELVEDPVVAELRESLDWLERFHPKAHRGVLALIEDRNEWRGYALSIQEKSFADSCAADEIAALAERELWRAATGCDTPDEARSYVESLHGGPSAHAEIVRLRGELDAARFDARQYEASANQLRMRAETAESEVAHVTARAEAAEKERDELREGIGALRTETRAHAGTYYGGLRLRNGALDKVANDLDRLLRASGGTSTRSVVSDETEAGVRDTTAKEGS